ncbi:Hsp20/alpha crystallin family protein [Candidatus Woesearchaeota archaeon]|nr:Hsp20/alpha crystallin family protein [Candidatus Woesearchaeota archaeon]
MAGEKNEKETKDAPAAPTTQSQESLTQKGRDVTVYDVFRRMDEFMDEMSQSFFGTAMPRFYGGLEKRIEPAFDIDKVNIEKKADSYVVSFPLSEKMKPEELRIDYGRNTLLVSSRIKSQDEVRHSAFESYLPGVDRNGIKAKYENKVLTINLPFYQPKKIEVEVK